MNKFDDATIADFLRRSYFAVDGLWFVKIEEDHSYPEALRLDEAVWKVMPKIQARKARQLLQVDGDSLRDLIRCFTLKLTSEGYEHEVNWISDDEVETVISHCPWYAVLRRTGREQIAEDIADAICANEFRGWASEFSSEITSGLESRLCLGCEKCRIRFKTTRAVDD